MMKNKSTIARLLAEEDIHVVSKKMDTAYFNIKKRELGLPIWKDVISKDEEELMVCHEIGHAIWTSMDMIDKSRKKLSINPKSYPAVILDLICAARKLNTFIKESKI